MALQEKRKLGKQNLLPRNTVSSAVGQKGAGEGLGSMKPVGGQGFNHQIRRHGLQRS